MKKSKLLFLLFVGALLFSLFVSCGERMPHLVTKPCVAVVGVPESFPRAEDFFEELPAGYSARFADGTNLSVLGERDLVILVTSPRGREISCLGHFTLLFDITPPELLGVKDITVGVGDGVAYRDGVSVKDDIDPAPLLEVDTSQVDLNTVGKYPVIYTATDFAGNKTSVKITLHVSRDVIKKEMLMDLLAKKLSSVISVTMTTEEKARAVYRFVYHSISYQNDSDKSDWVRAAYYGLTSGYGDCFTYFAVSKAAFEYLGIETMDIQRTEGLVTERHYWNLVNLGNDTWYHFDACHLLDKKEPWGCLFTDEQLAAYSRTRVFEATGVSNYFYAFNSAAYPARATTVITPVS